MGETGCGKTKLIKFMCSLRAGRSRIRNMLLVKVCFYKFSKVLSNLTFLLEIKFIGIQDISEKDVIIKLLLLRFMEV